LPCLSQLARVVSSRLVLSRYQVSNKLSLLYRPKSNNVIAVSAHFRPLLAITPACLFHPNFERINAACKIEEETFSDYLAARYYPVRIGEVLDSRYQVVGKLGYGAYSTVWLARDLK
jgi:hypothetical protein